MEDPSHPSDSLKAFAYRVLIGAGIVILLLLLVVLLWYAVDVLLVAFAGVLLAILLRGPADWLAERTRLSEGGSLAVVVTALLLLTVGLGFRIVPQVAEQVEQMRERLPEALRELRNWLQEYAWGQWLMQVLPSPQDLGEDGLGDLLMQGMGVFYTTVGILVGFLVVLFVMIYLVIDPRMYTQGLLHLVPIPERPRAAEVLAALSYTLRWWLIGSLIRMFAVGVMTFFGLWMLDVPLPLLLAILAFLLDFVPYFGPIVAAIPAVLIAFVQGPQQGLYVIILYFVVQQIESLLISPVLYQKTIYLPPVVTILAQILLGILAGPMGVILATPLTAVALVLVKMLYVEQTLGDYAIDRPERDLNPYDKPPVPDSKEDSGGSDSS